MALIVLSGLAAGCAPSTRLVTNKAPDYRADPKRIYVLFPAVDEFGQVFDQTFLSKTAEFTRPCGATVQGTTITGLELDQNASLAAVRAFNPDALLVLRRAGGTKDPYGRLIHVAFNIEFVDGRSSRTVWRAKADFHRGGLLIPIEPRAETFAADVTGRLKADGILKCGGTST